MPPATTSTRTTATARSPTSRRRPGSATWATAGHATGWTSTPTAGWTCSPPTTSTTTGCSGTTETGRFTDVAPRSGIADPFDTFNAAWGDFDGDGALELFAVGHVANVLFHNDGPVGGFVHLNLVGTVSNASAVGARVWLVLPGRKVNRVVEGASGAYGQDSLTVEFGVGRAPGPFRARILWPSGTVQMLTVPVNSVTTVIEP